MRSFIDFEFIENGDKHPIIPISLGIAREDEAQLYIEFAGVDWSKANEWVLENVRPYLRASEIHPALSKSEATETILDFVGERPEFWGYYCDYDWVIMCQLFGNMADKPEGWPMRCLDIEQYMYHLGINEQYIPIYNEQEHNALADADWNRKVFDWLINQQEELLKR